MYKTTGFKRAFVLILAVAILVAAGSVLYWKSVTNRLAQDARIFITQASEELGKNINRLLGAQLQVLTSLSVSLEDESILASTGEMASFLNRQNKRNSFELTGFQTPGGNTLFSNGISMREFLTAEDVRKTYEHSHFISSPRKDPFSKKTILVLAVPVRVNGQRRGIVFATQSRQFYAEALSANSLGEGGLSFIISRDGSVMMAHPQEAFSNIFEAARQAIFDRGTSLQRMQADFDQGNTGLTGYTLHGHHHFSSYYPLGYNGWYAVSVLSTASMAEKAQALTWMSLILCLSIISVLGLLLLFILRMQKQSSRALFRIGFIDPLTETDNLNAFRFKFAAAAEDFKAKNMPFALVLVNINRFKAVNDIYGFEQGDQILKQVAVSLRAGLQEGELFCRSGADVFLLLLACPEREELERRMNNLVKQAGRFCQVSGECLPLSLTCGIYLVKDEVPFYIMMDRANLAWAYAKEQAGEVCAFYDEEYLRRIVTEKRIESTMEQALSNGEFKIYLQPKCDFQTGHTLGAEALVRWMQPGRGLVPPDLFIPVFEKNGFVKKLDLFMLQETVKLLERWQTEGRPLVRIGVNFSRLHLEDPHFIDTLTDITDRAGVEHQWLEVELTESIVFGNVERMKRVLDQLHERGFSVAMDDFGSGYSSLNVLKNLNFDCIKLDKEFLAQGQSNPRQRKIISGLVHMMKKLNTIIVAEGVETPHQAEFLRRLGCDLAQGYLFSRPLPIDEFERRLSDEKNKTKEK